MRRSTVAVALAGALAAAPAWGVDFAFSHQWTFAHSVASGSVGLGAEIVAFDGASERLWVVGTAGVDVLTLGGERHAGLTTGGLGTPNSVAIRNGVAALSLTAPVNTDPGKVLFYDSVTRAELGSVAVGATPDMVTFTPDGSRLLVANEAEPNATYATDPEGSVSVIEVATRTVQTAGFAAFNGDAATLRATGVRIYGPGASVAQDLEPEYVAVSPDGGRAYVTLQENNALAVVDLSGTPTVTSILPLGLKDHSQSENGLDASDRDGTGNSAKPGNIQSWPVFGMYQPDAIVAYQTGGATYYVTANEGDARDYREGGTVYYNEEARVGDSGDSGYDLDDATFGADETTFKTDNDTLSRLTVTTATGDPDGDGDFDQIHAFGARSFSILDADGNLVFDSGDRIERLLFQERPDLWDDGRSDNKGPEPEGLALAEVAGRDLLFLGLERSNAVMVWDVTDPSSPQFLEILATAGDVGPEGLAVFQQGGDWYLAVANEVSATTTLYGIQAVPLPAALPLLAGALVGLAGFARARRAPIGPRACRRQ
jgi:3-phytase